jgi:LytS/YehU family sensor histidine kinase
MMLATLVENAVIHGLSPIPAGGTIRIKAHVESGKLVLEVEDDGRGLQETWGGGVGLANIRARLKSEYGGEAQLQLNQRSSGGVTATLEIPLPAASMAKAA